MTREDAKKLLPIIKAYSEGKRVQTFNSTHNKWNDLSEPAFDGCPSIYRIKPESTYKPFNNGKECLEKMMKHHPFCWITGSIEYHSISSISDVHIWLDEKSYFTFEEEFNNFNFANGTTFGIKDE